MRVRCVECGESYNHFDGHQCGKVPEARSLLIGVRVQSDLLERIDAARGGMTRPAWVRKVIGEALGGD